jgi:hypothetical protein
MGLMVNKVRHDVVMISVRINVKVLLTLPMVIIVSKSD